MPTSRSAQSPSRSHAKAKSKSGGASKSKSASSASRGRGKTKRSGAAGAAEDSVDQYDAEGRQLAQEEPETDSETVSDEQEHGAQATDAAERGDELSADGGEESSNPRGRNRSQDGIEREGKRSSHGNRKQPASSKR